MKITKETFKGLIVGVLICALAFGMLTLIRWQRQAAIGFRNVDAYIGACQRAGALPTVEALSKYLAEKAKTATQPKTKEAPEEKK